LVTASTLRHKASFRWGRRRGGKGHYAIALVASLAVTAAVSPAAAAYSYGGGYGGGHKHRPAHKTHEAKAVDHAGKEPFGDVPKGPTQIFISINQQKLHVYSDGVHVADTSIATGVPSLPTPLGVFSVIQKQVFHRSNIYSNAPMPYMQRITWSGVAMHEGENIGHPASHGCIRMPRDFAIRLYRLTKLNTRVIIARSELKPADFADPHLFVHQEKPPEIAAAVPNGAEAAAVKPAEFVLHASPPAFVPPVQSDAAAPPPAAPVVGGGDEKIENADHPVDPATPADAGATAPPKPAEMAQRAIAKKTPISIFISRKKQRLYIRQDFEPLFDAPVVIDQPDAPFGTHVFSALEFASADHTSLRWNVVSLPGEPAKRVRCVEDRHGKHGRSRRREIEDERATDSPPSQTPAQVLARIEIPPDVSEAIAQMIGPGASLIVSDQGLGDETGEGTDFIVVSR
jgi:lipoprotein-anchoring transpeptidase ErfK/SrfK